MGDFQLTWPGPRRPSLLGDYHLRLDPAIEAEINAIAFRQQFDRLRATWLRPDWLTLQQFVATQPQWLRMRPPAPSLPLVPRGAGPSTPRPAELSDLMRAIWAVPIVQTTANRVLDQATLQLRTGWRDASAGERGLIIGSGILFAATLAPLLSEQRYRQQAWSLIQGHDIPVPGVPGGWVRFAPRGAHAGFDIPGLSGSNIRGGFNLGDQTTRTTWDITINLDIAQLLRRAR